MNAEGGRRALLAVALATPLVMPVQAAPHGCAPRAPSVLELARKPPAGAKTTPARRASQPDPEFDAAAREATAAREAGRLEDAIRLYEKALARRPSWAEGLWYLGTINYDLDRYAEAADAFRRLVALQPKNGPAWAFKGLCEFQLRNYERALDDLRRAGAFGFGDTGELKSVARYHLALLLAREGQFEMALTTLAAFAQEGNDSPKVIEAFGLATLRQPLLPAELPADRREMVLIAGRASYYQAQRQNAAARKAFEELAFRYPAAPNVHYAFGVFLLVENPDEAIGKFRRELEVSPYHVPARIQLAFEYNKRGEFERALPFAREAVELAPNDFPARKAYGEALLGLGRVAEAVEQLERGVTLAPDSPGMRYALARAYARAGRSEDAARERAEFLRLDKLYRTQRAGPQAVGGIIDRVESVPNRPPDRQPPP